MRNISNPSVFTSSTSSSNTVQPREYMTERRVSVVIPSYNAGGKLHESVKSVLAQDADLVAQIVIVDDCSSDNTADVAVGLTQTYPDRVQVVRHPNNRGAAAARNTGARLSKTPWIAFLDADDIWCPNKLSAQFSWMATCRREPELSTTDVLVQPMGDGLPYIHHNRMHRSRRGVIRQLAESSISRLTPTILIRRELFTRIGGFEEALLRMEDHEFLIRAVHVGVFLHVPLPLTVNRVYPTSTRYRDIVAVASHIERFVKAVAARDPSLSTCWAVLAARVSLGTMLDALKCRRYRVALQALHRLAVQGTLPAIKVLGEAVYRRLERMVGSWRSAAHSLHGTVALARDRA